MNTLVLSINTYWVLREEADEFLALIMYIVLYCTECTVFSSCKEKGYYKAVTNNGNLGNNNKQHLPLVAGLCIMLVPLYFNVLPYFWSLGSLETYTEPVLHSQTFLSTGTHKWLEAHARDMHAQNSCEYVPKLADNVYVWLWSLASD